MRGPATRGNSGDVSDADAVANRGDGMSPRWKNSENATNEAKIDETVISVQNKDPVRVAANSGVESALDSGPESFEESRGKRGRPESGRGEGGRFAGRGVDEGYAGVVAEGG